MARFNLVIQAVYHAEDDGLTISRMEAGPTGGVLQTVDESAAKPYWVYNITGTGDLIGVKKWATLDEATTDYIARRDVEV